MKSKYETLCSVVEYVKNESYNPIAELLLMGFTPCQLVNEFQFDEEKVKACPIFPLMEEKLNEKLEERDYPYLMDGYSPFDAALISRFLLSKEQINAMKHTSLYQEMKECYKNKKEEVFVDIMNDVLDSFEEELTETLKDDGEHSLIGHKISAEKLYKGTKNGMPTDADMFFGLCMEEKNNLSLDGVKAWEYAIQQVLEKLYPDKEWYELTSVSIFMELLSGKTPSEVCELVWRDIEGKVLVNSHLEKKESLEALISKARPLKPSAKKESIRKEQEPFL